MYDEREQNGFSIGNALANLALILGGGAAAGAIGRKLYGKTAIPSREELSSLYTTLSGKIPTKSDLLRFKQEVQNNFTNPQQSLGIPAATPSDYIQAAQRTGQRGVQNVKNTIQNVIHTPIRNPLAAGPTQLELNLPDPTMSDAIGYAGHKAKPYMDYVMFINPFGEVTTEKAAKQAAMQGKLFR